MNEGFWDAHDVEIEVCAIFENSSHKYQDCPELSIFQKSDALGFIIYSPKGNGNTLSELPGPKGTQNLIRRATFSSCGDRVLCTFGPRARKYTKPGSLCDSP